MIGRHKHILHIALSDMDAFGFKRKISLSTIFRINVRLSIWTDTDSQNNLFMPFLELMYVYQFGQARIHIIISFLLMIGCRKHILLIGVNDIDAL